jgi:hypothetical protein
VNFLIFIILFVCLILISSFLYHNNRWVVPEEYRLWKEKVDALEKKQQEQKQNQLNEPQPGKGNNLSSSVGSSSNIHYDTKSTASSTTNLLSSTASNKLHKSKSTESMNTGGGGPSIANENKIVYSSIAEATEAFKELLTQKGVSPVAKMKEVQDLCQSDPRWEALKTMGEKKQALAEYQVRILFFLSISFYLFIHLSFSFPLFSLFEQKKIDEKTQTRKRSTKIKTTETERLLPAYARGEHEY